MKKEEIAAKLRSMLSTDIKFERLSYSDLQTLYNIVTTLVRERGEDEQKQSDNLFPLGIIPAIMERAKMAIPAIREEVRKQVDNIISEVARGEVGGDEKRKKK